MINEIKQDDQIKIKHDFESTFNYKGIGTVDSIGEEDHSGQTVRFVNVNFNGEANTHKVFFAAVDIYNPKVLTQDDLLAMVGSRRPGQSVTVAPSGSDTVDSKGFVSSIGGTIKKRKRKTYKRKTYKNKNGNRR